VRKTQNVRYPKFIAFRSIFVTLRLCKKSLKTSTYFKDHGIYTIKFCR